MYIHDVIYGSFDITEKVLLDLLEDPSVKRVAHVMQGGTTPQLWGWPDFSRLEHCIGAMLLVRKLGGSLEEQIAALLHDVPHTAFSHVIDVVFNKNTLQNFHEEVKEEFFEKSAIPRILKKYGYDIQTIMDESNFGLLERASPMLCADRVDYGLRIIPYYFNDLHLARDLSRHLVVWDGQIVFDEKEAAVEFTRTFLRFVRDVVMGLDNMAAYQVLADAIRYALTKEYISKEDLFTTDDFAMGLLRQVDDEYISVRLNLLRPGFRVQESLKEYHFEIKTKLRWVNSPYLTDDGLKYALDADEKLAEELMEYKERVKKPFFVRVDGL